MKNTTFWIIISVAVVLIAVGTYFAISALKDESGKDNDNGFFAKFRKKNNGGNGGNSGNNTTETETIVNETKTEIPKSASDNAYILFDAIKGLGTDTNALQKVLGGVNSQTEWDEIQAAYLEISGKTFKQALNSEWGLSEANKNVFRKILTDKGIEANF